MNNAVARRAIDKRWHHYRPLQPVSLWYVLSSDTVAVNPIFTSDSKHKCLSELIYFYLIPLFKLNPSSARVWFSSFH